jgi:Spy/CpxP family protein refolding chaperone
MLTRAAGTFLALAITTTMLAAPPAQADRGGLTSPGRPVSARLQERLGLTPEQTQAIEAIRERNRETAERIGQALRQARRELRQLALRGADDETIQAKAAQVGELQGEALRLRVKTLQEMAPLFTEEQRQKMEQLGSGGPRGRHGPRS